MGTTPTYALPYPASTDAPDAPSQMRALAEKIEGVWTAGQVRPTWARASTAATQNMTSTLAKYPFTAIAGNAAHLSNGIVVVDAGGLYLWSYDAVAYTMEATGDIAAMAQMYINSLYPTLTRGATTAGFTLSSASRLTEFAAGATLQADILGRLYGTNGRFTAATLYLLRVGPVGS